MGMVNGGVVVTGGTFPCPLMLSEPHPFQALRCAAPVVGDGIRLNGVGGDLRGVCVSIISSHALWMSDTICWLRGHSIPIFHS